MENLVVYIPMDRRHAISQRGQLPNRTYGAALFADISGFTPLTEALVRELGPQRGAEELTNYLNLVYDAVIEEVHRYGGSVIAFAGDAITCWLDDDNGARAVSAALAMQQAMRQFAEIHTPAGSIISLTMKAAVAVGAVRRFLVGDPASRVLDALAGETLVRLAAAEHQAEKGEVIVDATTLTTVGNPLQVAETRLDPETRQSFYVVGGMAQTASEAPWPNLATDVMDLDEIRTWLLPSVYERITRGLEEFLAELRPTVALFLRFEGIDYDGDEDAGQKLDAYMRWVQGIVAYYEGTLIDLNIGDKGSYLYINFGAPLAHENNAARAASAALALGRSPLEFPFITEIQLGISQGRMRAGVYGGSSHRTYGVLGDEVNMAARLMMKAQSGEILVSQAAQLSIADMFAFRTLPPMRVKGKSEPVTVYSLEDRQSSQLIQPSSYALPMVGREEELQRIAQLLEKTRQGHGQIVALIGEAGVGKSRLMAEVVNRTTAHGWQIYSGACESYGMNSSYLVWHPIWRGLLGLDATSSTEAQIASLTERLRLLNPNWIQRLPLLDVVLQLPIPNNSLTHSLDAKLRKTSLHALLVDLLRAKTVIQPTLIILEDCHWIDSLSYELFQEIERAVADRPVCIFFICRELETDRLAEFEAQAHASRIDLQQFHPEEAAQLIEQKLTQLFRGEPDIAEALVTRLVDQSQGNPFYLEELTTYLYYQGLSNQNGAESTQLELPDSLHRLVLSRLDQLSESQKITARIASVIGRVFQAAWLWGAYPALGDPTYVRDDLTVLNQHDLTVLEPTEPELTYFFKQVLTQNVTYESLPYAMRSTIHDQIGQFIEQTYVESLDQYLDLLAYHYDNSENDTKRREYLLRAAGAAQDQYANESAIDYYRRALPLLAPNERIDVQLKLGQVLELTGYWQEAETLYQQAHEEAERLDNRSGVAWSETAMGELFRKQGQYEEAWNWLEQAKAAFEELDDPAGMGEVLHFEGTMAAQQGEYERSQQLYSQSLALREEIGEQRKGAHLLGNMGIVARFQGDLERANTLYTQSLEIRRKLGDRWGIANSLNNLGILTLNQGDLVTARQQLEEALAIHRELGDRYMIGNALNNLGNVVRAQGDYPAAAALYSESLTIYRDLEDLRALAYLLEDVGWLVAQQDQGEAALRLLGAAATLREKISAPSTPDEERKLNEALAPALASIDQATQAKATAAGRALSLADAIDYALTISNA